MFSIQHLKPQGLIGMGNKTHSSFPESHKSFITRLDFLNVTIAEAFVVNWWKHLKKKKTKLEFR